MLCLVPMLDISSIMDQAQRWFLMFDVSNIGCLCAAKVINFRQDVWEVALMVLSCTAGGLC